MDYMNPFSMYQNVNSVPTNPFMSGVYASKFQEQAKPFMDMAQQSQGFDLQKKGIDTREYQSPEAILMRELQRRAAMAKDTSLINMQPKRDLLETDEINAKRTVIPEILKADVAKAREAYRNIQHNIPMTDLFGHLAGIAPTIAGLDPSDHDSMANIYFGAIRQWRLKHPNTELPKEFARFHAETMPGQLMAMHQGMTNTPEFAQKSALTNLQGEWGVKRENVQGQTSRDVANIQASASRYGADRQADARTEQETPAKAIERLRRELRKNPQNTEVMLELQSHLDGQFEEEFRKGGEGMRHMQLILQGKMQQAAQEKAMHRKAFYQRQRIDVEGPAMRDTESLNQPRVFSSEADAAKANLAPGTPIIINGVRGTWQ